MKRTTKDKLDRIAKASPSGERYLLLSDVAELIDESTPSLSTFRRRVAENVVSLVEVGGVDEPAYRASDVESFLEGALNRKRGGARRRKPSDKSLPDQATPSVREKVPPAARSVTIRPMTRADVGDAYRLLFNEAAREQLEFENVIQPGSMIKWVEDGSPIFWIVEDSRNTANPAAVFGVIPLDEELIIRFLQGEFALQEIAITDVHTYQVGQSYACYIIAAADPAAHRDVLVQLMDYLLLYWCEQYPGISIRMLYVSTPVGLEETPLLRMVKTFFFSRRRDISTDRSIWELPLNEYNPSSSVKQFQRCIEEKKSMIVIDKPVERLDDIVSPVREKTGGLGFSSPLQFRPARTREDVAAMVQIGAEIFVPPGVTPSVANDRQVEVWYSWLEKNPKIFHVVTSDNEVVGYISLIPLPQDVIDKIMRGAHPTTITPDDILAFEPGEPLNAYVHIWGTTPRLTETQKSLAGALMIRELRKIFVNDFARRGVDVRYIYTRSNKEDGIGISQHLGMEDLVVPGVTDAPDPSDRKHVFRVNTATSSNSFMAQYRRALDQHQKELAPENVGTGS